VEANKIDGNIGSEGNDNLILNSRRQVEILTLTLFVTNYAGNVTIYIACIIITPFLVTA
jgi:hypothetical protein